MTIFTYSQKKILRKKFQKYNFGKKDMILGTKFEFYSIFTAHRCNLQAVNSPVCLYVCVKMIFLMCFFTSNLLLRPLSHLVQSPNSKSDRLQPIKANCN